MRAALRRFLLSLASLQESAEWPIYEARDPQAVPPKWNIGAPSAPASEPRARGSARSRLGSASPPPPSRAGSRRCGKEGPRPCGPSPPPGGGPRLSPRQTQRLGQEVVRGRQVAGYATELWTCPWVAARLEPLFGGRSHPAHVWRLLSPLPAHLRGPGRDAVGQPQGRGALLVGAPSEAAPRRAAGDRGPGQ